MRHGHENAMASRICHGGRMHEVSLSVGFGTEKKVEWFLVGRVELKNTRS